MARVIIVSNRVPTGKNPQAGGLAVALIDALKDRKAIWIGWSGSYSETGVITSIEKKGITYVLISPPKEEWNLYYNGFANDSLWPLLHYRAGLLNFDGPSFQAYCSMNQRFADAVTSVVKKDDLIWIHDYHFLMMGRYLRDAQIDNRIGHFFHTPFPPASIFESLPRHHLLGKSLLQLDLVGFQTRKDYKHFSEYTENLGATLKGDGNINYQQRSIQLGVFPVEIDSQAFTRMAEKGFHNDRTKNLRTSLVGRKLILGIDRLDYSKGLPERFSAYRLFLKKYPKMHRTVSYLQITPRSRENVTVYSEIRRQLERKAGQINGEYADIDWVPLRYLNKTATREDIAGYMRLAEIGLVTPMRDGMNLIAKEYVAAQDPDNPGVLILSRFAGAADQLSSALLVNPFDIEEMADTIYHALTTPLAERKEKWRAMMNVLSQTSASEWAKSFLSCLAERINN